MMKIWMFMSIHLLGPMMTKKHYGPNKPNLDYPYLSLPDIEEDEITFYQKENKEKLSDIIEH